MDGLVFNPKKHEYFYQGVKFPSVTQIIADAGLYGDTSFYTDYSRDRGTLVHIIIQWHLGNMLDESSIDPVLQPYFNAWCKFVKESAYVSDDCERPMANDIYRFAGTVDHVGHINGDYCLIDVKTGAPSPAWPIQLAAYSILLKGGNAKRFSLQLKDDGNYKLTEHKDRQDKQIFLAALSLYYWKQNYNLKGK